MDFGKGRPRNRRVSIAERELYGLAPGEMESCDEDVSIGESLKGILAHVKLADEHWLNQLRETWDTVAGDIARHTRPGRIDGKCLFVSVDSSVWLAELSRYGGDALLRKIAAAGFADKVSRIRFEIDGG